MAEEHKSPIVSTLGQVSEYAERVNKIAEGLEGVATAIETDDPLLALKSVLGLWQGDDDGTAALLERLDRFELQLQKVSDEVVSYHDLDEISAISSVVTNVVAQLDQFDGVLKTYDTTTGMVRVNGANRTYLDWFGAEPAKGVSGQSIPIAAIFDQSEKGLATLLSGADLFEGTDGLDRVATVADDAAWGRNQPAAGSLFYNRTPVAALQALYLGLLRIYRRAVFLHQLSHHIAAVETYAPRTADPRPDPADVKAKIADYMNAHPFVGDTPMNWSKLTGRIDAMLGGGDDTPATCALTDDNSFSYRHGQHNAENTLVDAAATFAFAKAPVTPPQPDAFITGLRLQAVYRPETERSDDVGPTGGLMPESNPSEHAIWLQAHYSRLLPGGRFEALGWFPQQQPPCDHSYGVARIGALDIADLALAASTNQNLLVMTGIGIEDSGDPDFMGIGGTYAQLAVGVDGAGKLVPFDAPLASQRSQPIDAHNYLRIEPGTYVKNFSDKPCGRIGADGAIDPSAIVTNVWLGREPEGDGCSTLFLKAQVATRWHDLPRFRPDSTEPYCYPAATGLAANAMARVDGTIGMFTPDLQPTVRLPMYYALGNVSKRPIFAATPWNAPDGTPFDSPIEGQDAYIATLPTFAPYVYERSYFKLASDARIFLYSGGKRYWIQQGHEPGDFSWTAVQILPDVFAPQVALIPCADPSEHPPAG